MVSLSPFLLVQPVHSPLPLWVASLRVDGGLLVINSTGGDWMQVVNGKEEQIVKALAEYGLCNYEARMFFSMLTIGEAKALTISRKASVPNSKTYEVLDILIVKFTHPERIRG